MNINMVEIIMSAQPVIFLILVRSGVIKPYVIMPPLGEN